MTPKEKASELVAKYRRILPINQTTMFDAKNCALIAVNEIISSREDDGAFNDTMSYTGSEYYTPHPMYLTYWKKVKKQIEKL